jgi:hypothetical protein
VSDLVMFSAVVLAFALFGTVHLIVCASLVGRTPVWKLAIALFVPPLAPAFAVGARRTGLAVLWTAAAVTYGVCLWMS